MGTPVKENEHLDISYDYSYDADSKEASIVYTIKNKELPLEGFIRYMISLTGSPDLFRDKGFTFENSFNDEVKVTASAKAKDESRVASCAETMVTVDPSKKRLSISDKESILLPTDQGEQAIGYENSTEDYKCTNSYGRKCSATKKVNTLCINGKARIRTTNTEMREIVNAFDFEKTIEKEIYSPEQVVLVRDIQVRSHRQESKTPDQTKYIREEYGKDGLFVYGTAYIRLDYDYFKTINIPNLSVTIHHHDSEWQHLRKTEIEMTYNDRNETEKCIVFGGNIEYKNAVAYCQRTLTQYGDEKTDLTKEIAHIKEHDYSSRSL